MTDGESDLRGRSRGRLAGLRWAIPGSSDPEGGLSPLQRYSLDVNGFLLLERALAPETVAKMRALVAAQRLVRAGESIRSQRFGQAGALFEWDPLFVDLIDHPWTLAILRELIGSHVRLDHAYGIAMRPGTSGLGLHGPAEPFDPAQFYVSRMGALRSGLLAFSWSLTDGKPGDGGFGCIPGSHQVNQPVPPGAESLVVEVPQPAGSLLVFTEALVHCTIPWSGDEDRLTLMLKYSPGNSAWDPSPAAGELAVQSMSDRQRRFFKAPSVGGHHPVLDP